MNSDDSQYQPGKCNIGKAEIDSRLRAGLACSLLAASWAFFSGLFSFPLFWKLMVFFPATAAAITLLQVYYHFCAYFGLLSVFNFGPKTGKTTNVLEAESRKLDQAMALKIIGYGAGIAAVFTLLAVLLT